MESWPFKVVDANGQPKIEVQYLGESKQFSAQEISAMVLTKVHPYCTRQDRRGFSSAHSKCVILHR